MSGELEVTAELRKKVAEENAAALARLGLDPGKVEEWEDGYRTAKEPDAFEWWYFDAQFDDGSTAVIVYNTKPHTKPKAPLDPSVLLIYRPAEGKRESYGVHVEPREFSSSTEGCDVRVGKSWVRGDLRGYRLHAEAEDMALDLELARETPSWRPGAAISYFNSAKTRYFAWVVPIPYGTVRGTIDHGGERRDVKGTVYHDHNWGNAVLGGMLDHWYWGRAHVGDFSVIYVQMVTVKIFGLGGVKLPVFFLAKGDKILTDDGLPLTLETSGEVEGPGGQTYPTRLDFHWEAEEGSVNLAITDPKLVEDIDTSQDLPGWSRALVHLFAHPYYYDFDAELELTVDLEGVRATERGRTIFEKMMFR
ncbi:MAG: lipocalin-like domain-containing protein [Actinomycetota bacterium]|nr:lipocalin-like domain-containing protein [Actinomycetota bacterium]